LGNDDSSSVRTTASKKANADDHAVRVAVPTLESQAAPAQNLIVECRRAAPSLDARRYELASSEALSLRDSLAKDPYTAALRATERNVEAAREGTIVLTHKLLGLAQRNANTALNLITKSVNAKSFAELIELNFTHSFNQFYALFRQADEFGELFVRVFADVAEAAVSHVEEESNGSR
jgi:hypothetical protein